MNDAERQLLADTARNLIRLIEERDDTVAGMTAALLEMYRLEFATMDRRNETIARLKLNLTVLERKGRGTKFLAKFIEELERWPE